MKLSKEERMWKDRKYLFEDICSNSRSGKGKITFWMQFSFLAFEFV